MRNDLNNDLRMYWNLLNDVENFINEQKLNLESKLKSLKYLKGEIRKRNKWLDESIKNKNDGWRVRYPDDGYYDSRYVKYKLPFIMSEEEKKEFIEDEWCHWYNPYNDGRDCTGVWFTNRIKLIDCGNETIVIHVQNCDV